MRTIILLGAALALISPSAAQDGLLQGPTLTPYGDALRRRALGLPPTTTLPLRAPPATPARRAQPVARPAKSTRLGRGTARGVRGALLDEAEGTPASAKPGVAARSPYAALLEEPPPAKRPVSVSGESRRRTRLALTAESLGRRARSLTRDDVAALVKASRPWRSRWYAAPELHDALRAVAREHPDATTRRVAARRARQLDLDAHQVELRRAAFRMRDQGKRGVEIWSGVARLSVDHHLPRRDITAKQKYDEVMADLASVFNGPDATRHLKTFNNTLAWVPPYDPHINPMIAALERRQNLGTVEGNMDQQRSDFRRAFDDGTRGQIYHTGFFHLLGYATGNSPLVNAPNLYHETFDPNALLGRGGSVPDWQASAVGIQHGRFVRHLRDAGYGERGLKALPSMIGGTFSNHPLDFTHPWGPSGPDFTGVVRSSAQTADQVIRAPQGDTRLGRFASNFQRGLVYLLNGR